MAIRREALAQTDFSSITTGKRIAPVKPGHILRDDFMKPLGLTANALAQALRVPANRITGILNGTRAITADTALRLARYFGTDAQSWLNLQTQYELEVARRTAARRITHEVRPREAA
jgi:addiction module HigA family antidote